MSGNTPNLSFGNTTRQMLNLWSTEYGIGVLPLGGYVKMLGQEDVFTKAAIEQQLKNIDKQFDQLMQAGIPEDMRAYLGMMGFKVIINIHGEVLKVDQPGTAGDEGGE